MHARYYSSVLGRFFSVDPILGSVGRPQSWNRYAYVEGNSLNYIDPDGLFWRPFVNYVKDIFNAQVTVRAFTDDFLFGLSAEQYARDRAEL